MFQNYSNIVRQLNPRLSGFDSVQSDLFIFVLFFFHPVEGAGFLLALQRVAGSNPGSSSLLTPTERVASGKVTMVLKL